MEGKGRNKACTGGLIVQFILGVFVGVALGIGFLALLHKDND